MGNSARDNNAYGTQARPASAKRPNAMTAPPKLVNNQIPTDLRGAVGGAWSPAQTQAGGRWEVPAGAPAGAIGRNWVPMPAPVEPRQQMAQVMAHPRTSNGIYYPNQNYGSAWSEGGRGGRDSNNGGW